MANTVHTIPDIIADFSVPLLEKVLAPFNAFTTNFTTLNRRTIQVPRHTVVQAVQTNPSSYVNTGDTTVDVDVSVSEYSAQFGITSQEALQGHTLEWRAKRHAHALAEKLWDVVSNQITAATFTNTPVDTGTEAAFDTADIEALYASIPGGMGRYLLLSPASYAAVMIPTTQDTAIAGRAMYGFDGVFEVNDWDASSLQANTHGIACSPECFLVASGIPQYTDRVRQNCIIDETIVEVPGVGISVAFRHQVSNDGRSEHATMDVLFGAIDGDESALTIIRTAA